jgi:hypothetical protein
MDAFALVAIEGFCEPGRECLVGELLWPRAWCGRQGCSCGEEFHGATSHGVASLGRVQRLRGVSPGLLLSTLADAMHDGDVLDRRAAAKAFLDEVRSIEEGRLVRREEGVLLPFPSAARIVGRHRVEYRPTDEP